MNNTENKNGRGRWFDRTLLLMVLLMQIAVLAQWHISVRQPDASPSRPVSALMAGAIENVVRFQSAVHFYRGWDALRASPSLDMRHTESGYLVTLCLPGVNPDDIGVLLDGRVLTVMALCGPSDSTGRISRYERRVLLPGPVGAVEEAQAHLTNGVLSVHIPRGEDYAAHRAVTRLF